MGRRRLGWVACGAALATLVPAASALAWRHPTVRERAAIARAARTAPHAGGHKVHVSRIRVSTAGPWASAVLTIYFKGQPDNAIDILRRAHGRWVNVSIGTSGEWCVMPPKDRRNLGFPATSGCG